MYRVVKISNKYYGVEIDSVEDDMKNIESFIETGDPVILCDELDDLEIFDIDMSEIKMIDNE